MQISSDTVHPPVGLAFLYLTLSRLYTSLIPLDVSVQSCLCHFLYNSGPVAQSFISTVTSIKRRYLIVALSLHGCYGDWVNYCKWGEKTSLTNVCC